MSQDATAAAGSLSEPVPVRSTEALMNDAIEQLQHDGVAYVEILVAHDANLDLEEKAAGLTDSIVVRRGGNSRLSGVVVPVAPEPPSAPVPVAEAPGLPVPSTATAAVEHAINTLQYALTILRGNG
jgi:hypothetical protein